MARLSLNPLLSTRKGKPLFALYYIRYTIILSSLKMIKQLWWFWTLAKLTASIPVKRKAIICAKGKPPRQLEEVFLFPKDGVASMILMRSTTCSKFTSLLLGAIALYWLVWNMSFNRPWNLLYKNWVGPQKFSNGQFSETEKNFWGRSNAWR